MQKQQDVLRLPVFLMLGMTIGAVISLGLHNIYGFSLLTSVPTILGLLTGFVFGIINNDRRIKIKHIFAKLLHTKNLTPKLPRTWGREWLLLFEKNNFYQIVQSFYQKVLWMPAQMLTLLIILTLLAVNCLPPAFFFYTCLVLMPLAIIMSFYNIASDILSPLHFSRMADKKLEERDSKMEAFKKQLPEHEYRIASLSPPSDIRQIRILLEANHPLPREQRDEAQAVIDAQEKLKEAEGYTELAQAQTKSHTS